MGQRFTLDRPSFEQFLGAASFLQQVQRQAACNGVCDFQFAPLLELVETQHAIESGNLSLETAIRRIVALSMKIVGASGAAAWLFTQNEFVFCAGAGSTAHDDERLRLQVLARLAGSCQLQTEPPLAFSNSFDRDGDDGYYPGSMKSLLVAPIYQGRAIAGAVAASSPELDAFQDRDATNLRLLAGLVAHALNKTAAVGLKQTIALEKVAMLKVIQRIMPGLQQLVEERVQSRNADVYSSAPPHDLADSRIPDEKNEFSEDELKDFPAMAENHSSTPILNACQKTFGELPLEPVGSSWPESKVPADDVSIPFVGVRAALGGEVAEDSHFWASLLNALASPGRRVAAGIASFFRGLLWELEGLRDGVGRAGVRVRHAFSYRPKFPAFVLPRPKFPTLPQLHLREGILHVRASATKSATRVMAGVRTLGGAFPKLPARPSVKASRAIFRHRVLACQVAVLRELDLAAVRLRAALRKIPEFPSLTITFPRLRRGELKHQLAALRVGFVRIAGQGRAELAFALRHRPRSRSLRRAAPAGAILVVMVAFLISEAGLYHPSQTAVASGRNATAASVLSPSSQSSRSIAAVTQAAAMPTHRQITDPTVMDEVQELSRYEIAGIRRLADSGDDYSEFELGMLYETGHGMTQSCSKAAEWVVKAAEQGNPAAEYNLGLRYRDGDGVAVSLIEADKWLQRAAAHKYSHPKLALAAVNTH